MAAHVGGRSKAAARLPAYAWAAGCLVLAAVSAVVLTLEARPYFASGLSAEAKVSAIAGGGLAPGPSFFSQRLVLGDCLGAMESLLGRASPTPVRQRLLDRCDEIAGTITSASPTHGHAWFVAAYIAAERGDAAAFNAKLVTSHRMSPSEGWLAVARISLAEKNAARLSPEGLAAEMADIGIAIAAFSIDEAIIERYISDEVFRGHVDTALASQPTDVQTRFIGAVRAALREVAVQ